MSRALRIQSLQDVQTYRLLMSCPRDLSISRQENVKRFLADPATPSAFQPFADFEDSRTDPIALIEREARREMEHGE